MKITGRIVQLEFTDGKDRMIQSLFHYLKGYVKIGLPDILRTFPEYVLLSRDQDMELKSVGNAYEMYIKSCGLQKASSICT